MIEEHDEENDTEPEVVRMYGNEVTGSFGFSGEIEAPPRDIERALGSDTIELASDLPLFKDGAYRPCGYCDGDSIVHVDDYEGHLRDEHGIEP